MSLHHTMLEATCTIRRPLIGRGASQGTTQSFAGNARVIKKDIRCSVQPATPTVQLIYAQREEVASTTIYFDQDPLCEPNDVADVSDGNRYLLQGRAQPTYRNRIWTVNAERIR